MKMELQTVTGALTAKEGELEAVLEAKREVQSGLEKARQRASGLSKEVDAYKAAAEALKAELELKQAKERRISSNVRESELALQELWARVRAGAEREEKMRRALEVAGRVLQCMQADFRAAHVLLCAAQQDALRGQRAEEREEEEEGGESSHTQALQRQVGQLKRELRAASTTLHGAKVDEGEAALANIAQRQLAIASRKVTALQTDLDAKDKELQALRKRVGQLEEGMADLCTAKSTQQELNWDRVDAELKEQHHQVLQQLIDARIIHAQKEEERLVLKRQIGRLKLSNEKLRERMTTMELKHNTHQETLPAAPPRPAKEAPKAPDSAGKFGVRKALEKVLFRSGTKSIRTAADAQEADGGQRERRTSGEEDEECTGAPIHQDGLAGPPPPVSTRSESV